MAQLKKESKRYKAFLYWWDITPKLAKSLDEYETIEFIKKDTGESCSVSTASIKGFLVSERQTSRGDGNWGIKVLVDHPDKLAFEPGANGGDWLFLPVIWANKGK